MDDLPDSPFVCHWAVTPVQVKAVWECGVQGIVEIIPVASQKEILPEDDQRRCYKRRASGSPGKLQNELTPEEKGES